MKTRKEEAIAEYYDRHGVLDEILEEPVDLSMEDQLREDILEGQRKRRLKSISIKVDPLHIQAIRKIATMKSIPYQTLIRHWLSEGIRRELHPVSSDPQRPC